MLRTIREERQVILAIMALWLLIIAIVTAVAWLTTKAHAKPAKVAPKQEAACIVAEPLLEEVRKRGIEHEVIKDRTAVLRFMLSLITNLHQDLKVPTSIVVAFIGEDAHIGLIYGDKFCPPHLTAPASAIRQLVRAVHGQTISDGA